VGGGNSAGQAAVYLSSQVAKVWLIVRKPDLAANMSRYLVERITATPNIEILTETTVTALDGHDGILEAIRCHSHRSGDERTLAIRHLFLFIGADPNTDWLSQSGVMLGCRRDVCWNLFGAVSGWMRILDQAARSIGLSASFRVRVSHPSTLRMVI
jgi:thioredoxin reductase (NADPH)